MIPIIWHAILSAVAVAAAGRVALRAWRKLRRREIAIELLVTVAVAGALLLGEFWEAAAVAVLFLLGERLEARALRHTRRATSRLIDLMPQGAVVLREGVPVEVTVDQVGAGDVLLIRAGARIPVDGEVVDGHAAVDESPITGESLPAEKSRGSKAYAGTINRDGTLWMRATGVGAETALARIARRVEEALEQKTPAQRLIDRFARWYTPGIIALAILAFLLTQRIELALTLLVIGCPGALVIATPAAVMAGIGRAAQLGILIKGGAHLEIAGTISALAFDKTGTLTEGRPRLTDVSPLEPSGDHPASPDAPWTDAQKRILKWAAVAEASSGHPIAQPIMAEAGRLGPLPCIQPSRSHAGRGVEASCASHAVAVGSLELMRQAGAVVPPAAIFDLNRFSEDGKTAVVAALDGRAIGVLAVADAQRESACAMVKRLKSAGVSRIVMLTGDDRRVADAVARKLGIDEVHAGLLPSGKLQLVREMQAEGEIVAMVGDGINDAPALAAADVGIAMGIGATDLAAETADIVIMTNDLVKIPEAIRIARATVRIMWQNIAIAMLTVAGLLAGVATGSVHMATGMLVHEMSVLIVTLNAIRLLRA